jgi:cell division protein FtsZ
MLILSAVFINETQIHPKINLKKEILENTETQINEDQIQQTISKDSDLFSIEKQRKFTDHQIDLIDMDQQNQEIDEDVLEIPAFLRRQAN